MSISLSSSIREEGEQFDNGRERRRDTYRLRLKSIEMRLANLREVDVAGSCHYGRSFSTMEILVSLCYGFLRVRSNKPQWTDRDRFILSKGHACSALYPILADLGFFPQAEPESFTRLGSLLGDHPDMRKGSGCRLLVRLIGPRPLDWLRNGRRGAHAGPRRAVAVLLGDSELNEGQVWETVAYSAHRRLSNLLAIVGL